MSYTKNAIDEVKAGEKALKGGFFSNFFGSKDERNEKAIECFQRAANFYKLDKKWKESGELYQRCATLFKEMKQMDDVADMLMSAGDMFKNDPNSSSSITEGTKLLREAAENYCRSGQQGKAAKIYRQIGQYWEENDGNEAAIEAYKKAAEFFDLEKFAESDSNKMNMKVAELLSTHHDYTGKESQLKEAVQIYEKLGKKYLSNNLLRHSAKDIYIKCLLLFLVMDDNVGYERKLEKYTDDDPSLINNMEFKMLKKMYVEYEAKNVEQFTEVAKDWHQRSNLDKWKTSILATIKQKIDKGAKIVNKNEEDQNQEGEEEYNPF